MKKIFFIVLLLAGLKNVYAQTDSTEVPAYKRLPAIPPFSISIAPDSMTFVKDDLKRKKPVMIIIFSPDCGHCQHFTKELLENYASFKKAQIVMASSRDFAEIKKFYQDYKIADYPSITMGRDVNYFLGSFYKTTSYPTVYLYDKKGNFVKLFTGTISMKEMAEAL